MTVLRRIVIVFLCFSLLLPHPASAAREDALSPTNWTFLGNAAADRGDLTEAIADYTQAIRRNSLDPVPLFDRARAYDTLGRLDDALADAKMSVSVSTSFANGYELIARLDRESGRLADATSAIGRAIAISPPPVPIAFQLLRAQIAEASLKPEDAIAAYAEVLRSDRDNPSALYGTARIFLSLSRPAEALPLLTRYANLEPKSENAIVTVAQLLIQLNHPSEAIDWLKVHPSSDPHAIDIEAKALILLGRSREALTLLGAESSGSELRDALLGEAAMNLHDCAAAESAFSRVVHELPQISGDAWRDYGIASLCAADPKISLSAFDRAIEIDASDASAYRYRSDAYRKLGYRRRSIEDAKMAIKLGNVDADILMMLGIDEYDSGDREAGRRDYGSGCRRLTESEAEKRDLCRRQLPMMKSK